MERLSWIRHTSKCMGIEVTGVTLMTDAKDVIDLLWSLRRMTTKEWAVDIRLARLREIVDNLNVRVMHIAGTDNPADELTKPVDSLLVPAQFPFNKVDKNKTRITRAVQRGEPLAHMAYYAHALPSIRRMKGYAAAKPAGSVIVWTNINGEACTARGRAVLQSHGFETAGTSGLTGCQPVGSKDFRPISVCIC